MLTCGYNAMLFIEVTTWFAKRALQNYLEPANYNEDMITNLEELDEVQLGALDCRVVLKNRADRAYDKIVKAKSFCVGDLVWKIVLPIGDKSPRYGKWSSNWEGPFIIEQVLKGGAYHLSEIHGESHSRSINGRYCKKYYPTLWETTQIE